MRFLTKNVIESCKKRKKTLRFEIKGSQEHQLFGTKSVDTSQHEGGTAERALGWSSLIGTSQVQQGNQPGTPPHIGQVHFHHRVRKAVKLGGGEGASLPSHRGLREGLSAFLIAAASAAGSIHVPAGHCHWQWTGPGLQAGYANPQAALTKGFG